MPPSFLFLKYTVPANLSISESYGNWTFDTSLLTVPTEEPLSFCSNNSFLVDFFQTLVEVAARAKITAIVSLVTLAVLAAAAMALWEIKRYKRIVQKSQRLAGRAPMDISYLASRPLTASAGLWLSAKLTRQPRRQVLIRWVIAYATRYTALFVLSLALAGGFSCLCQFLVLRAVQAETPALAAEVGTAYNVTNAITERLAQASTQWANASNAKIVALQSEINDGVLSYVLQATSAVNATLFKLNEEVNGTLISVFGDTQLEEFFYGIYGCILGDKLTEVDEGINWVHAHARVSLPLFPTDVFSFSDGGDNNNGSSASSHIFSMNSTTTTTTNEITAAVNKVVNNLWTTLVQEGLISLVLLLVYIAYVFFGVAQASLRMCFSDRYGTFAGDRTFGRLGM